ncbi:related to benzoate 4-monooxygenase cytochrome P450 [Fusarium fujikuroi]|nr:related to benzoate 4-monooxygenase cytochrome P450 [Fusarium fujikuroi]
MHKTHPVIRTGPNSLSYGSIQAIKDIYGHGTKCTKGEFYETLAGSHYHLADVIDKADHARKRQRFIRAADAACTLPLKKGSTRPEPRDLNFDYRAFTNFFTLDAIADIGLSERLGFLDQGHDRVKAERMDGTIHEVNFRECLHSTARAQSILAWTEKWYNFNVEASKWFSKDFRQWWHLNEGWNDIVYHRATKRLGRHKNGERLPDFFQALMDQCEANPPGLEWGEIVAEVSIMMNAGSDTTSIAMNNVMYWLLKNPSCMAKLREEVDSVLDPEEVVAPYDKAKHLPYLRACLDESLRITPPTTFGLPRRTPPEGWNILGDFIPGDTTVSISAYVTHRDPQVFPDPESYAPERWLGEKGKELQPYFIAFSAGARGCIGRNISYLEQTVLLASVVHRYEWALPYPEWEP